MTESYPDSMVEMVEMFTRRGLPVALVDGRYRLCLEEHGLCAWEMSADLARTVRSALGAVEITSAVLEVADDPAHWLVIGRADRTPAPSEHEGVGYRSCGVVVIPTPKEKGWRYLPVEGMPYACVDDMAAALTQAQCNGVAW